MGSVRSFLLFLPFCWLQNKVNIDCYGGGSINEHEWSSEVV